MRSQTGLDTPRGRPLLERPTPVLLGGAAAAIAISLLVVGQAWADPTEAGGPGSGQTRVGRILGTFPDSSGVFANVTPNPGVVNASNAFFDPSLGTNGQACVTCHQPSEGFSVTTPFIDKQFDTSQGLDPLFRANDTATRPDADLSSLAKRRDTFQLALDLGLFRIGKTLPASTQFTVLAQNTPRFGPLPNAADPQSNGQPTLSLFRRPLATTNMRLESVVLWDGRQNVHNLRAQVKAAARTLMLGSNVSDAQADSAASFMTSVFTAQDVEHGVGNLSILGAHGGAQNLQSVATSGSAPCLPLTDPAQGPNVPPVVPAPGVCTDPTRPFDLYTAWAHRPPSTGFASVARGEQLFNTRQFSFPGVPGTFTCTGCHTTTDVGNFPFVSPQNAAPNASLFVRYGLDSPEFLAQLATLNPRVQSFVNRTAGLPVYTISISVPQDAIVPTCGPAVLPDMITGQLRVETLNRSTDLGRAMVTGLCADIGGFKPPILRGLATHAPYFHNGAAATIEDVVNFYDTIFQARFTDQERADLAAFLRSL
jgi:cytochrome c peroxidase